MVKISLDYIMAEDGRVNLALGENKNVCFCEREFFMILFPDWNIKNAFIYSTVPHHIPEAILTCSS